MQQARRPRQARRTVPREEVPAQVARYRGRAPNGREAAQPEARARAAADRIMRGEEDVARTLGSAPAARAAVPESLGEPLPQRLRKELERSFGAELSTVRIHHDHGAAHAAVEVGATAFTSGRDVYFAAGAFDPAHPEGRRLLLHELGHVLQQTGRAGAGGRTAATPAVGTGEVQLAPKPDFPTLVELHRPPSAERTATYRAYVARIRPLLEPSADWTTDPAVQHRLSAFVEDNEVALPGWPAAAESLLYDTLKGAGSVTEAAALLEQGDFKDGMRIRTASFEPAILDVLQKRNGWAAFTKHVDRHPLTRPLLAELYRLFRVFLAQPTEPKVPEFRVVDGKAARTLIEYGGHLVKQADGPAVVGENEWTIQLVYTIIELDKLRVEACEGIAARADREAAEYNGTPVHRGLSRALQLKRFAAILQNPKREPGAPPLTPRQLAFAPLLAVVGKQVEQIAAGAEAVWMAALTIESKRRELYAGQVPSEELAKSDPFKLFPSIKGLSRPLGALAGHLDGLAERLFSPGKGGEHVPGADEYAERVEALAKALDKFAADKLGKDLTRRLLAGNSEVATAEAALWLWCFSFSKQLRAGKGEGPKETTVDFRLAHRIRSAQALWALATPLAWTALAERARRVLRAVDEPESQLALVSDWEDEHVKVEEMRKDFGSRPLQNYEPLTAYDLALFFQAEYHRRLTSALVGILPRTPEETRRAVEKAGSDYVPLLKRAVEIAGASEAPERWRVADFAIAAKVGDTDFPTIMRRHPKAQAKIQTEQSRGRVVFWPIEFTGRVFLWSVPSLEPLVEHLRRSPQLNATVQLELKRRGIKATPGSLTTRDWIGFLHAFVTRTGDEGPAEGEVEGVRTAIGDLLRKEESSALADLTVQLRRATSFHRQVLASLLRPRLVAYGKDDVTNYQVPNETQNTIDLFSAGVSPGEDSPLQTDALVLELAEAMHSAFVYETRYDVIDGLSRVVKDARKSADAARAGLKALLPPEEATDDWIADRAKHLDAVIERFASVSTAVQRRFGLRTSVKQQTLMSLVFGFPIERQQEPFKIDGRSYRIVQVHRDFIYHPAYGTKPPPGVTSASSGYLPEELLEPDGKTQLRRNPGEVLLEMEIDGVNRQITGESAGWLDLLSQVVDAQGFVLDMKNLAYLIDTYTDLMLDIAELIPGVGPAVVAVRIIEAVTQFMQSGDYEGLKQFVKGQVLGILEGLLGDLQNQVSLDSIWQFFLFGDEHLDRLLSHSSTKTAAAESSPGGEPPAEISQTGKTSVFAKMLAAFKKLGHALVTALRTIHRWVQIPMQSLRDLASTRPLLSLVFQWLGLHLAEVVEIVRGAADFLASDDPLQALVEEKKNQKVDDVSTELHRQQDGLVERVGSLLAQLERLELPKSPLHIEPVVAWMIGKLMVFVGKRVGVYGKAITLVLDKTGLIHLLSRKIADELVGAGLDPNIYWRDQIVPAIQDDFNAARDALADEIRETLAKYFPGAFDEIRKPDHLSVQTVDKVVVEGKDPFADANVSKTEAPELFPLAGLAPLVREPQSVPPVGAGRPLDGSIRSSAERRFGHDFGHVRLHAGSEGAAMTGAFGADALTTGSHVFLRPGLTPGAGPGREALDHELVHVLQQTGSRPPGRAHRAGPVLGRSARGLHVDPAAESAATRVARGAEPGLVHAGDEEGAGIQPALLSASTVGKLLYSLADLDAIKKREQEIEAEIKAGQGALTGDEKTIVDNVVEVIRHLDRHGDKEDKVMTFSSVMENIRGRLGDPVVADGAAVIGAEAIADKTITDPDGKKRTIRVFDYGHFARELEAFVLASTGIGIALKLNTEASKEPGRGRVVFKGDPVAKLRVFYVHLPYVGAASALWAKAIENTWPGLTDEGRKRVRAQLRGILYSRGVVAGVWPLWGSEYRFSFFLKRDVDQLVKAAATGTLSPDDLPPWSDYVVPDILPAAAGTVGLRLGTYATVGKLPDREIHHTTQFLLLKYFANASDRNKPFRKDLRVPGIVWGSSDQVDRVLDPGSGTPAQAGSQLKGRGPDMPAISIARVTHQQGKVHITGTPDDEGESRPSYTVHSHFRQHLPDPMKAALDGKDIAKAKAYVAANPPGAQAEVFGAMQETYRAVRKDLAKRLFRGLESAEYGYYSGVAEGTTRDLTKNTAEQEQFKAALGRAATVAYQRNDAAMAKLGWNA
jgi:hypothetical protein